MTKREKEFIEFRFIFIKTKSDFIKKLNKLVEDLKQTEDKTTVNNYTSDFKSWKEQKLQEIIIYDNLLNEFQLFDFFSKEFFDLDNFENLEEEYREKVNIIMEKYKHIYQLSQYYTQDEVNECFRFIKNFKNRIIKLFDV